MLKAKIISRPTLYFNKYEYRVVLTSPNMRYSNSCETIDDYKTRIASRVSGTRLFRSDPYMVPPEPKEWEYHLIENILNVISKYKDQGNFSVRREDKICCIYTNDHAMINEILSFAPEAKLNKIELMPSGVLQFKREAPARYRAYLTNSDISPEFKKEFLEYIERTPDIMPSISFHKFLNRGNPGYRQSLWDKYYIDYSDEKNLMMISLMFPGIIGKKYKLETVT